MNINIRILYLYLFSFVGLLIVAIGSIRLVELGLKLYVFKGANEVAYYPMAKPLGGPNEELVLTEEAKLQSKLETTRQRQREVSGAVAMVTVGLPLYMYHWKVIQREK